MPARSKRPSPPARMVELLAVEKERVLAEGRDVTRHDFEEAWAKCWNHMIAERAWPHATIHRRAWRSAMIATRSETRAAFVGDPTPFAFVTYRLVEAAEGMCVWLEPEQIPKALLAAIAYVESPEGEEIPRAA
jgi:hypothetical protein